MPTSLVCPVCHAPLSVKERSLVCPLRHSFDMAKSGYVNLLLKKAGQHGDNDVMLAARQSFLSRGYYAHLAEALKEAVSSLPLPTSPTVLDCGTGEGYYLEAVKEALKEKAPSLYGFDISKQALLFAAKRKLGAALFVASAYSVPMASESVDLEMLFFSPFCREESLRVLKKNGYLVMAIPAEAHLWELKQLIYDTPYRNELAAFEIEGFSLLSHQHVEKALFLPSQEEIQLLFQMTPYYYKTSPRDKEKTKVPQSLSVTAAFELLVYQKQ